MQTAFETTTRFAHRPDEVWQALTDWSRLHEWMPGVRSASGPEVPQVGAELRLAMDRGERISTVSACERHAVLAFRSTTGPVTAEYRYELTPRGASSSDVRIVGCCEVAGPLRVLAPLIRRTLRRTDGDQLTALRRLLDG